MNREDIIRMAREAGLNPDDLAAQFLERFAALVAGATAKEYEERLRFTQERWEIECKSQVEIEREAAIKRASVAMLGASHELTLRVIRAIRARGQ